MTPVEVDPETRQEAPTFADHWRELRSRTLKGLAALLLAAAAVFPFSDDLVPILARPVGRLVFLAPSEALAAQMKLALVVGGFLASPYILFQLWRFVAEGLLPEERRLRFLLPLSWGLFALGAGFGLFVILPLAVRFLLGFAGPSLTPMISVSRYVSFAGTMVTVFGVVFELPLVLFFLTMIGWVTPEGLASRRREAVVLIFIVAALVTPPDVVTQGLLALPLVLLYELGIVFSRTAVRSS